MKYRRDLVIIMIFLSLTFISTQSSILEFTEVSLAGHMMLEHLFFFLLGAISVMLGEIILSYLVISSASHNNDVKNRLREEDTLRNQTSLKFSLLSKWKHLLSKIFSINRFGYRYIWIIVSVFILAIWHVPSIFDFASQHIQIHILQHISFIIVGATGFLAIRSFGESNEFCFVPNEFCRPIIFGYADHIICRIFNTQPQ